MSLFVLAWAGLLVRLATVQVLPNKKLSDLRHKQYESSITLNAVRGNILDRNGVELASSISVYSLFADPHIIKNPKTLSKKISKKLNLPYKDVLKKLSNKDSRFVWIKRKLDASVRDKINSWKEYGIGFIEESQRIYPKGSVLSQVLGFVGNDGKGLEGLEGYYDDLLAGKSYKKVILRDAKRRPLLGERSFFFDRPEGKSIQLTVDQQLQYKLAQELDGTVRQFKADSALGIILDVNTSEVIAMGNYPFFDANMALKTPARARRNKSVTDSFEPGSTFKPFTIAAALEENLISPNDEYDCKMGSIKVDGHTISEAEGREFGKLTVIDILAKSSNICISKIALKIKDQVFREYIDLFGFGHKTDVDFWGESYGILPKTPWKKVKSSTIAFGHGISVTPIQIANAYAMLANGGILNQPYILRHVLDSEGNTITDNTKNRSPKRVLSKKTAKKIKLMLMAATSKDGTGAKARVIGYHVAGKTGTAQKVSPDGKGYLKDEHISSFAGFVPANDPKFVIYIAVDNPKIKYFGSEVAAPIFSKLAYQALLQEGIQPAVITKEQIYTTPTTTISRKIASTPAGKLPDLEGLSLKEVMHLLKGADIKTTVVGAGTVVSMKPKANTPLSEIQNLYLFLE